MREIVVKANAVASLLNLLENEFEIALEEFNDVSELLEQYPSDGSSVDILGQHFTGEEVVKARNELCERACGLESYQDLLLKMLHFIESNELKLFDLKHP